MLNGCCCCCCCCCCIDILFTTSDWQSKIKLFPFLKLRLKSEETAHTNHMEGSLFPDYFEAVRAVVVQCGVGKTSHTSI